MRVAASAEIGSSIYAEVVSSGMCIEALRRSASDCIVFCVPLI